MTGATRSDSMMCWLLDWTISFTIRLDDQNLDLLCLDQQRDYKKPNISIVGHDDGPVMFTTWKSVEPTSIGLCHVA